MNLTTTESSPTFSTSSLASLNPELLATQKQNSCDCGFMKVDGRLHWALLPRNSDFKPWLFYGTEPQGSSSVI